MRYENLKIAMNLSIIIAITGHFVAEVIAPHQDGVIMSILRAKVSRDRRRGDGQCQVHRRHGRLRPLARGHDSALWERPMTNDYFKQAVADTKMLEDLGLDEKTKEVLVENINRKSGIAVGTPDIPVRINLIAPPV